jgi:hypothetical protein
MFKIGKSVGIISFALKNGDDAKTAEFLVEPVFSIFSSKLLI